LLDPSRKKIPKGGRVTTKIVRCKKREPPSRRGGTKKRERGDEQRTSILPAGSPDPLWTPADSEWEEEKRGKGTGGMPSPISIWLRLHASTGGKEYSDRRRRTSSAPKRGEGIFEDLLKVKRGKKGGEVNHLFSLHADDRWLFLRGREKRQRIFLYTSG